MNSDYFHLPHCLFLLLKCSGTAAAVAAAAAPQPPAESSVVLVEDCLPLVFHNSLTTASREYGTLGETGEAPAEQRRHRVEVFPQKFLSFVNVELQSFGFQVDSRMFFP